MKPLDHAAIKQMNVRLGALIKHYRKRENLTQEELADAINIHWVSVSRWENGKGALGMSLTTYFNLCKALNLHYDVLLDELNV